MHAIRDGKKIGITEIISKFLDNIENNSSEDDHHECEIIVFVHAFIIEANIERR